MENRELGDYRIIKQIGQGSMGAVYLAEHRLMKRQFVLKVLPQELSSDRGFIQRFEEDIASLSSLDHPHIAKVHNVSFAEGQYFLVSDCIVDEMGEATTLTKFLISHPKPLKETEVIRILKQIGEALDYAHQKKVGGKGIVHRCLKPNNILISKGGEGIDIKVSDFGLSRIIGVGPMLTRTFQTMAEALALDEALDGYSLADHSKLPMLHQSFLQNYLYLAPEQRKMKDEVDIKADVYAFGVLAYYLIMRDYPEGVFLMPSEKGLPYTNNWDYLITVCLQQDPRKRPDKLMPLLEEIGGSHQAKAEAFQVKMQEMALAKKSGDGLTPIILDPQIDRPQVDEDPAAAFRIDTTVKHYHPEEKDPVSIIPLQTEMVIIKGGTFWRGSNEGNRDETPRHQVTLSSFALDKHPVTNEQFVRFLEVMGGEKDYHHNDIIRLRESRIKRSAGKISIESGYAKHPVVGVSWYGAVAYAKWVGKRLPTEAEWEIAAKGGLEEAFYTTGEDIEKSQANFFSSDTTPVMSYAPNGYDLYDMAGNVYEWCQDWYSYNYYELSLQEPENPKGPLQGVYRVLRGGCWKSLKEDLCCSRRHRNNPGTMNSTYGFRCATDVR